MGEALLLTGIQRPEMKTMKTRFCPRFASLLMLLAVQELVDAAERRVPSEYATIQEAVDAAADDDVIHLASGVYAEQVEIFSKKLTLVGQPGTILRATENMLPPPDSVHYPILFADSSRVTLRGLTFEGERLADHFVGVGELIGVVLRKSSGTVENCAFYGFRERRPAGEETDAIFVNNRDGGDLEVEVRVAGSTFADNFNGIWLLGSGAKRNVNATIENNVFIGPGPLGVAGLYAIFVREGVGGRIAGNTMSGFSYSGQGADFPICYGILADNELNFPLYGVLERLEIEGNTFRDNQMHLVMLKANSSVVRNNRFQGTAPGIDPMGLAVSGTNVTIAANQFESMPEGIRLLGNNPLPTSIPGLGDLLGYAVSAQVMSNRFCSVTMPINRQSPATSTETGTSLDACTSRPLSIAPAVLLSWPGDEERWTVESATSVDGPWNPVGAASFKRDGRNNVALPTQATHQFFRLK